MAAKLWVHVDLIDFFLTFPFGLLELCCQVSKEYDTPLSSQRVFDEYVSAVDVGTEWEQNAQEARKAELEKRLTEIKRTLDAEEDFTTMTVLCYLKVNQEKYMIVP